jgi:hypothetical protein
MSWIHKWQWPNLNYSSYQMSIFLMSLKSIIKYPFDFNKAHVIINSFNNLVFEPIINKNIILYFTVFEFNILSISSVSIYFIWLLSFLSLFKLLL